MRIEFFNTFHPVVPFFEDTFRHFEGTDIVPVAVISDSGYREGGDDLLLEENVIHLGFPKWLPDRKWLKHIVYGIKASWVLLLARADACVFLTQPPLFWIWGALICRMRGVRYGIHAMDFYPEMFFRLEVVRERGLLGRLLSRAATNAYRKADAIFCLGPCSLPLVQRHGVLPERVHEVPNWPVSTIQSIPAEQNPFIKEQALQDSFVVLYSGNLGRGHLYESLAEVARELEGHKEIVFVIIGHGQGLVNLRRLTDELSNVRYLAFQDSGNLSYSLSAASVHFVSLRPEFTGVMVPSKIYGCLASGRPTVFEGSAESTVAKTILDGECGAVVEPNDSKALKEVILAYAGDQERCRREGLAARRAYEEHYLSEHASGRYAAKLRSCLAEADS